MKKITIVILNYNGWGDTNECLESLKPIIESTTFDVKLVVVDNKSKNESISRISEKIAKLFPNRFVITDNIIEATKSRVVLFCSNINFGFSGGNNIGIKIARQNKSDYVLLLNNDTTVEPNFLHPLVDAIQESGVGIVGPKIKDYYDRYQFILGGDFKRLKCTGVHYYNTEEYNHKPVSFLSGCCWLISMDAIEECGLMDENYFLYVEDVDYCYRFHTLGYKLIPVGESVIYHKEGRSTTVKPMLYYYNTRNRLYFCKKNKYKAVAKVCFHTYLLCNRVYVAIRNNKTIKYIKQAYCDFFNNKFGPLITL